MPIADTYIDLSREDAAELARLVEKANPQHESHNPFIKLARELGSAPANATIILTIKEVG